MKISKEVANKFYKKLEYRFKKSNSELVQKLNSNNDIELDNSEIEVLLKKLEYKFKNSDDKDLNDLRNL